MGLSEPPAEKFGDLAAYNDGVVTPEIKSFMTYLVADSKKNSKNFLDILWKTTAVQKQELGLCNLKMEKIRSSFYDWNVDNNSCMFNWKSGLFTFFMFLIILVLIIACATKSGS